jgi:esterase/lipase
MTLGTKFDWTKESAAKETKMLNPDVIETKVPAFAAQLQQLHGDWRKMLGKTAEMMLALANDAALTEKELSKILHEVQITLGSEDNMVGQEESMKMAAAMTNAKFKLLENLKHPMEKADANMLAGEILSFIS